MKLGCLFFLWGLLFFSASAFGELSVEDWEKFRAIVKEEVSASEKRTKEYATQSEKRTKEHTTQEVAKLIVRMDRTDKHRAAQFEAIDNRFGDTNQRFSDVNTRLNFNFVLLVALIGAVIGLPLFRDRKKEREQDAKIEAQQKLLEAQQQRIEAQQRELEAVRKELASLKQPPTRQAEPLQSRGVISEGAETEK